MSLPSLGGGAATWIRDDLEVPVLQFETETDLMTLGFLPARQPDSDRLRTWEVTGTAHADQHLLDISAGAAFKLNGAPLECPGANTGPQHFVTKAALHALNTWLVEGTAPATGDTLEVDKSGAYVLDDNGNSQGGIRTPAVDVPISTLSGTGPSGGSTSGGAAGAFCGIFGSTTPFPPEKLMKLYPTRADYVAKVAMSAADARKAGFLLSPEEQEMVTEAKRAAVSR